MIAHTIESILGKIFFTLLRLPIMYFLSILKCGVVVCWCVYVRTYDDEINIWVMLVAFTSSQEPHEGDTRVISIPMCDKKLRHKH